MNQGFQNSENLKDKQQVEFTIKVFVTENSFRNTVNNFGKYN